MHDEVVTEVVRWHEEHLSALASGRTMRLGRQFLQGPRWLNRQRHRVTSRGALRFDETFGSPRFALIADEFTEVLFEGTGAVLPLHPIAWRRQLERFRPDVLFVESAWLGHEGWWRHELSHVSERGDAPLRSIVNWCRRNDVPTIFWNKEDPVHFHQFLPVAELFDLVLTTEETCVDWYRDLLGHDHVAAMPFPINPRVHHPVNDAGVNGRVMFAGSWIAGRFPGREAHLRLLLAAAHELDVLDIFARERTTFPHPYDTLVREALPYRELLTRTRTYSGALNVNSVSTGRTMVARRVPEMLGMGVPVISSPTPALANLYDDLVFPASDPTTARAALEEILDEDGRQRRSSRAWRRLHSASSIDDAIAKALTLLGACPGGPDVTVIVVGGAEPPAGFAVGVSAHEPAFASVADVEQLGEWVRRGPAARRVVVVPDLSEQRQSQIRDLIMALRFDQAALIGWTTGTNHVVRHVVAQEIDRAAFALDLSRVAVVDLMRWLDGSSTPVESISLDDTVRGPSAATT